MVLYAMSWVTKIPNRENPTMTRGRVRAPMTPRQVPWDKNFGCNFFLTQSFIEVYLYDFSIYLSKIGLYLVITIFILPYTTEMQKQAQVTK